MDNKGICHQELITDTKYTGEKMKDKLYKKTKGIKGMRKNNTGKRVPKEKHNSVVEIIEEIAEEMRIIFNNDNEVEKKK